MIPSYMSVSADNINRTHTYNKVYKGDWVIEEMPKAKEKEHLFIPTPDMS